MTTIDHQQEAIRAIAAALHGDACPADPDPGESCGCGDYEREAEIALTAAAPHLRAAWEQELREAVTDEIRSVVAAFSDRQMETLLTGDLVAAHERITVLTHSKETTNE